jgi:hypothetical protein
VNALHKVICYVTKNYRVRREAHRLTKILRLCQWALTIVPLTWRLICM